MPQSDLTIIGAGVAGLCTGIYAQMNGYSSEIFEMHNLPGGLCTAWKRKGYTIDGCIHWLVGSSPNNSLYELWKEVGMIDGLTLMDHDTYGVFEDKNGRRLSLYCDVDRLEKHLLEFSPQDEKPIREWINGIRFCMNFEPPSISQEGLRGWLNKVGFILAMIPRAPTFQKWMKLSAREFSERFKDPLLRQTLLEMWYPDFSVFFMLMTFAWLAKKSAGYPIGGSMPMARALEKRYLDLGGQIHYNARVEKILVEKNPPAGRGLPGRRIQVHSSRATGVRLADGSEHHSRRVISAADGHATIYDMLEGKFVDPIIQSYYDTYPTFPPLLMAGVGLNRLFDDEPRSVSGLSFELKEPVVIGGETFTSLPVHLYNFDPTLAPAGKSVLTIMLNAQYDHWKALAADKAAYQAEKEKIIQLLPSLLEQRWPGISQQIEMIDLATPVTFEHFTGNWKASFEGWLMTPQNVLSPMRRVLPGLTHFFMVGQWVSPGGGLPSGVQTARELIQDLCAADRKKFQTKR